MDQEYNQEVPSRVHKPKKSSFESYNFFYELYKALVYKKFHSPLPIQKKAIPVIMQGRDTIVSSKTGSGKTLGYLLPTINKLKCHSPIVGARALILVPTRELAKQVADVLKDLLRFTDIRYAMILGGHSFEGQFQILATNPDILIATPGRLMQLIVETGYKLGRVDTVIFDEADNLFEKGFRDQMTQILKQCPSAQKLMFSATIPEQLNQFARAGLKDYVFIQHEIALPDKMVLDFLVVRNEGKLPLLLNLLKNRSADKVIVFASTRYQVDLLQAVLSKRLKACIPIYGKMEMADRTLAIADFRACRKGILIVTDLASRGLDIPDVGLVIHFDYPSSHKIFVHRSGRTARKNQAGHTIAFVNHTQLSYMIELCYVIGRNLVRDSTQKAKDTANYGSVPGSFYDIQEEDVRSIFKQDDDMKKLLETSERAMEKFRKCRTPASSYSIKLSKQLVMSAHPRFRMMDEEQIDFIQRIRKYNPQRSFLEMQKISQDKEEGSDPFLEAVEKIRRQQNLQKQAKLNTLRNQTARQGQLQEMVKFNKQEEHKLKEYREKRSKEKLPVSLPQNYQVEVVSSRQKKSQIRDFRNEDQYINQARIPGVNSEFDDLQKINTNELDQNLNDQGRLKTRAKRVWDSKSKTFKFKRDKEDKMSKDQKGKHAYLKWKKSTHLSLQKVGEVEDKSTLNAAKGYWQKRRKFAQGWKENKQGKVNDQAQRKSQVMRKKITKRRMTGSLNAKKGIKSGEKGRGGKRGSSGPRGASRGQSKGRDGAKRGGGKGGKRGGRRG